jgi:spermidine/putrescine-binding protein
VKQVAFVVSLIALLTGCHKAEPTLSLLVWEGYADPSFIKPFEQKCHCKVSAAYMGSSDELIAKLRGGSAGNYDVISPSSDVATTIASAGLAMPQWGPNPLLYDTTAFKTAPDSWNVLWDPALRGKVSVWDDLSTVYMAAQVLGYDKPDPNAIYNLTDDQLSKVKAKLLELKPNIRKMWSTGGELTSLFEAHEITIAMGWPLMTNQLRAHKFPIGETIPKENTTGWIDHLMITSGSQQPELAYQLLEYLSQAPVQKQISAVTGYLPANPSVAALISPEERHNLHLDDLEAYQKRIYFWQNVPRRDKYNQIWNEVKAAE